MAAGRTADEAETRPGEYATYAPANETCRVCGSPFKTLDRVWRIAVDRPSGPPAFGGYRHYERC